MGSDKAKIVPIAPDKLPEQIELTDLERLELENHSLKLSMLGAQMADLKKSATKISAKMREHADTVSERLGVEVKKYRINPETGIGRLIDRPEKPEPEDASNGH